MLPQQKDLFVKIASLLQEQYPKLKSKIAFMVSAEENDGLRKLALLNLKSTDQELLVERLRDRSKDIRLIAIRKMRAAKIPLTGIEGLSTMHDCLCSRK